MDASTIQAGTSEGSRGCCGATVETATAPAAGSSRPRHRAADVPHRARSTIAPHRILVADDEALVATAIADALKAESFEVAVAGDGVAALEVAVRMIDRGGMGPDALVTDLHMPRMDGEDLAQVLRGLWPDLPVAVVTGSRPEGGVEALRRRVSGHGPLVLLDKPLATTRLTDALRSMLASTTRRYARPEPAEAPRREACVLEEAEAVGRKARVAGARGR